MNGVKTLSMTAGEIKTAYRQAKDKKEQIKVLAELNACTAQEILAVLRGCGVEPEDAPDETKEKRPYRLWTEEEIRELSFMAGFGASPAEIGEKIGRTERQVQDKMRELFGSCRRWKKEEKDQSGHLISQQLAPGGSLLPASPQGEALAGRRRAPQGEGKETASGTSGQGNTGAALTRAEFMEMVYAAIGKELEAGREALLVDMLATVGFMVLRHFDAASTEELV